MNKKSVMSLLLLCLALIYGNQSLAMAPNGNKKRSLETVKRKPAVRYKRSRFKPLEEMLPVTIAYPSKDDEIAAAIEHNNKNVCTEVFYNADLAGLILQGLDVQSCGRFAQVATGCAFAVRNNKELLMSKSYQKHSLDPIYDILNLGCNLQSEMNIHTQKIANILHDNGEQVHGVRSAYTFRKSKAAFSPWHCEDSEKFYGNSVEPNAYLQARLSEKEKENCKPWHLINISNAMTELNNVEVAKMILDQVAVWYPGEPIAVHLERCNIDDNENGLAALLANYPIYALRCTGCTISSLEKVAKLKHLRELFLYGSFMLDEQNYALLGQLSNLVVLTLRPEAMGDNHILNVIPELWKNLNNLLYLDIRSSDYLDNVDHVPAYNIVNLIKLSGLNNLSNLRILLMSDHRPTCDVSACKCLQTLEMRCARQDLCDINLPSLEHLSFAIQDEKGTLIPDDVNGPSMKETCEKLAQNYPSLEVMCVMPVVARSNAFAPFFQQIKKFSKMHTFMIKMMNARLSTGNINAVIDSNVRNFGLKAINTDSKYPGVDDIVDCYLSKEELKALMRLRKYDQEVLEEIYLFIKECPEKALSILGNSVDVLSQNKELLTKVLPRDSYSVNGLVTCLHNNGKLIENIDFALSRFQNLTAQDFKKMRVSSFWQNMLIDKFAKYIHKTDKLQSDVDAHFESIILQLNNLVCKRITLQNCKNLIVQVVLSQAQNEIGAEMLQNVQNNWLCDGFSKLMQEYCTLIFKRAVLLNDNDMKGSILEQYAEYISKSQLIAQMYDENASSEDRSLAQTCLNILNSYNVQLAAQAFDVNGIL